MKSKFPATGTTIFSQMTALALDHKALNLSQGFPDFQPPQQLLHCLSEQLEADCHQYAPMQGVLELRQQIAESIARLYTRDLDPESEITITSGATEALFCVIACCVHAGDEVIVFDPAYDSYEPAVQLQGGRCVHIPLTAPEFVIDWQRVKEQINNKTRLIIVNTPHNPTGSILSQQDLLELQHLAQKHDLYVLADEVYEHMVFDGQAHHSIHTLAALNERSFVVSSFGKALHATGWKIGFAVAAPLLTAEFRKIHQYITFSTIAPEQIAIAHFLKQQPQHITQLRYFYQDKRDLLLQLLAPSKLTYQPCSGSYFQLLNYNQVSDLSDVEFCAQLVTNHGLAAIPISVFYQDKNAASGQQYIRLCFAKDDETLIQAAQILCQI